MLKLRDYQHDAVDKVRDSYLKHFRAPLLVLPTGGGKTIVFSHISASTASRNKKVIILVHRVELLRQTYEKLADAGVRVGLVNPKYTPDASASVQVASVQTLVKRLDFLRDFNPDLIVIDEAHHATASQWMKCIDVCPKARILGVTATPCRGDGKGLGRDAGGIFDDIVIGPQVSDLIGRGFLVNPIVYAPKDKMDFSDVKTVRGDYDKHEIGIRMDRPSITGDAVAHYKKLAHGMPAVAFCVSIAHAEHVADEFVSNGYRAFVVDGKMEDSLRKKILGGLGNGSVDIVCSCDLISEGTDIPAIGCAILLRPTQSLGLYLQQIGRALRTIEGKSTAIVLDHVGNVLTHGMPTEDREWSLEGETKRKKGKKNEEKKISVKQCPHCYAMHIPAAVCPVCGHVYEVKARSLEKKDGELEMIPPERVKEIQAQKKKETSEAREFADLLRIQKERGYKNGWAKHVWAARNIKEMVV